MLPRVATSQADTVEDRMQWFPDAKFGMLIHFGRVHLYNLADDVGERHNIADRNPERVTQMRSRLHAWYNDVDAKFLQRKDDRPEPWIPQ